MRGVFNTPVLTPALRQFARLSLWLCRWKVEPHQQVPPPFVFIGAPHTSNWDFILMLTMLLYLRLDARWLGKHTLFRFPFGGLMRWLGGIPVDRSQAHNLVPQVATWLKQNPHTVLCVPPEGTRRKVDKWKTGFYYIALRAEIPILMTAVDAENHCIRILGIYTPTGAARQEIPQIQRHYQKFRGIVPENTCDLAAVLEAVASPPDPDNGSTP